MCTQRIYLFIINIISIYVKILLCITILIVLYSFKLRKGWLVSDFELGNNIYIQWCDLAVLTEK